MNHYIISKVGIGPSSRRFRATLFVRTLLESPPESHCIELGAGTSPSGTVLSH